MVHVDLPAGDPNSRTRATELFMRGTRNSLVMYWDEDNRLIGTEDVDVFFELLQVKKICRFEAKNNRKRGAGDSLSDRERKRLAIHLLSET